MFSALILPPIRLSAPLQRAPEAYARTLAALVSAAVADLVRDVQIIGAPGEDLRPVADAAGCALVSEADAAAGFARALGGARNARVLAIHAGYAPNAGFVEELEEVSDAAALRRAPQTPFERLFPGRAVIVGLAAARADFASNDLAALARRKRAPSFRTRARLVV
ncbi:MAG: transposase [Hyphomicrobiales bacterium]|nr:transposase [Hyphomicrobiales bacterium]